MMKCPAPACEGKRKVEQLLCRTCWFRLPAKIRAELFRNWKAAESRPDSDLWWSQYRQSRFLAMHWLKKHPIKEATP